MKPVPLFLLVLLSFSGGDLGAQVQTGIDWDAEYKRLLESDPGVRKKIESGQTTKAEVIQWLKRTGKTNSKGDARKSGPKNSQRNLSEFRAKLREFVESGRLSKEDAGKLAAVMGLDETSWEDPVNQDAIDWDAEYDKLLKQPAARRKIKQSGASKEQVIEFLKKNAAAKNGQAKSKGPKRSKPGAREGSVNFYAIVIGRLNSKDVELGEMEIDVDYAISDQPRINAALIGKRVKLIGVSGQFLDALLQIKRGETIKVRTGDFNPESQVLGFGYKFHVLERTDPFKPGDFGVPPEEFRGFDGDLSGEIIEAVGYEVLLKVQEVKPSAESRAENATSIVGNRIRIAGFYGQNSDVYADLRGSDKIRLSVAHRNPKSDALTVTGKLKRIEK